MLLAESTRLLSLFLPNQERKATPPHRLVPSVKTDERNEPAGEEHSNTPITAKQIIHTITGLFPSESNSAYGLCCKHGPAQILSCQAFISTQAKQTRAQEMRHVTDSTRPEIHVRCKARTLQGNTGDHSHSRHSSDDLAWTAPQAALLMQDHSQLSAQTNLLRFDSLFFHSCTRQPSKNNSTTLPKKNGSDCTP